MLTGKQSLILLLIGHLLCSGVAIYFVFFVDKRPKKMIWLAFLLLVPYLSVFIYSATKRRPGRPASPTRLNT